MASITSLMGSSSSNSIYGTRNVISGLASGIDTEALIQNAVSGYQTKISGLNQKRTKLEWQQEALRGIITKMASFSNKFTSYTSSTNLMSASFFNNAVKVSTLGEHKDKVSASGKSSSDVQLLGVKQLATAATYTVSGGVFDNKAQGNPSVEGEVLDLSKTYEKSLITGSLTLGSGGSAKITIDFGKEDICKNGQELADKINEKLKDQRINFGNSGTSAVASERMEAVWNETEKRIDFKEKGDAGNTVTVLSATGDMKKTLGIESSTTKDNVTSISVADKVLCDENTTYAQELKDKEISFTLDGKTKKISLAEYQFDTNTPVAEVEKALQKELDFAFGSGKINVDTTNQGGLAFEVSKGSALKIDNGKVLGLASDSETSYTNTSKTLGALLGSGYDWQSTENAIEGKGKITEVAATGTKEAYLKDEDGNRVAKFETDSGTKYYRVDEKGNLLHSFEINGKMVGAFSKDTALESVMTTINGSAEHNIALNYSKITDQFKFVSKESGEVGNIRIQGGLAGALFGDTVKADGSYVDSYTKGQDAIFSISVNGDEMLLERSSNSVEVDGLTLNLKETFGEYTEAEKVLFKDASESRTGKAIYYAAEEMTVKNSRGESVTAKYVDADGYYVNAMGQRYMQDGDYSGSGLPIPGAFKMTEAKLIGDVKPVTFETSADADTIVGAIKSMVEDYNAMAKEIKDAYSTLPLQNSKGKDYEPLTDEDREGMSESAIKSYEEKAKTGLLFADRDLSSLYTRMTNALQSVGRDLEAIGISITYDDGLTSLSLNESKLRSTLEADPDQVRDAFVKSKNAGDSADGLMQALKSPLDMYAKTTGGSKGILIEKAGSVLSPTSLYQNTMQQQLDALEKQISSWQDKLSDKVDYYTSKFTQLEVLINEMNSQSSALAGLTGGY